MLILGIDPGTAKLGYGLIKVEKSAALHFVTAGCLETKLETPMHERLLFLYNELNQILKKYKPDVLAVENLFFGINAKTAIAVGQARGVILLSAANNGVKTVAEYQGLSVKFAITGFGRSKKKEIQEGVRKILKMEKVVKPDDAADGLAIAITHHIKTNKNPMINPNGQKPKPNLSKKKK